MANETGSTWGHQELSRRQVLRYSGVAAADCPEYYYPSHIEFYAAYDLSIGGEFIF